MKTVCIDAIPRPLWPIVTIWHCEKQSLPIKILVPDQEALHDMASFLRVYYPTKNIIEIPAWDILPFDQAMPDPRIVAKQFLAASQLAAGQCDIVIAEYRACLLPLPKTELECVLTLAPEQDFNMAILEKRGYQHVHEVAAPGEFCVRGERIDVWSPLETFPIRISRFDDIIEQIRQFDPISQLTTKKITNYSIGIASLILDLTTQQAQIKTQLLNRAKRKKFDPDQVAIILEKIEQNQNFPAYALWFLQTFSGIELPKTFDIYIDTKYLTQEQQRLTQTLQTQEKDFLVQATPFPALPDLATIAIAKDVIDSDIVADDIIALPPLTYSHNLEQLDKLKRSTPPDWQLCLTFHPADQEVLKKTLKELHWDLPLYNVSQTAPMLQLPHRIKGNWDIGYLKLRVCDFSQLMRKQTAKKVRQKLRGLDLGDVTKGDYIVHMTYGVGKFFGLERIEIDGQKMDMVRLVYRDDNQLLVPITHLNLLEPYHSDDDTAVEVDRLGSDRFANQRKKVKEQLLRFAAELIQLYATREQAQRQPLPAASSLYAQVVQSFPYQETPDQLQVLDEIEADLRSDRPMDRLLIGDVGFGKTEIALRTAVRFAEHGLQAAILVPTTVLAAQHAHTFHERLKNLPLKVGVLSRFTPEKVVDELIRDIKKGNVDIVIGTHRLLQADIMFQQLGLVVIDEEQRFGVKHKEALKVLRKNVDILSMSATPIPRTLQMHIGGLRDISVIATPPANRLSIETVVMPYNEVVVKEAILRERARDGQIFLLRNRIEQLEETAQHLQELISDLRIGIVHGQLSARQIEDVFLQFAQHQIDVMIATTIIESGLDFPRANTILIMDADHYGLAELYQLRGRVGRSDRRAFAYLFYQPEKELSPKATSRLNVLESFSHLGSGFQVAMRDLEIRGAGEMLGKQQAGHIKSVGLSTLFRLLEEALAEIQGQEVTDFIDPDIQGNLNIILSDHWIESAEDRLRAYQQLAAAEHVHDVENIVADLCDRFGQPEETDRVVFAAMRLKAMLRPLAITAAKFSNNRVVFYVGQTTPLDIAQLLPFLSKNPQAQLEPDKIRLNLKQQDDLKRLEQAIEFIAKLQALIG